MPDVALFHWAGRVRVGGRMNPLIGMKFVDLYLLPGPHQSTIDHRSPAIMHRSLLLQTYR